MEEDKKTNETINKNVRESKSYVMYTAVERLRKEEHYKLQASVVS